MKRIRIDDKHCMGCRLCEVHCIVQHSKTKNILKTYTGEYPKPASRILLEKKGYVTFALQCRHCEDAPCLDACMSGAMYRDKETGAVLCDEDKCVGCWMCIMVCPFGVIDRSSDRKIASKCDLCMGEDMPVCVKNCPNEALKYEDLKD
ncbi:MAG: 4Fe-4S dicluster domain-containing protein [bacterium]